MVPGIGGKTFVVQVRLWMVGIVIALCITIFEQRLNWTGSILAGVGE